MSYGSKFCAWLADLLIEALAFYEVISLMVGSDAPAATWRDVAAFTVETLTWFCLSGYALTTLLARLYLRGRWERGYPVIAALLFLLHFEIMNHWISEGVMEPHNRLVFRVIGSGVVIVVVIATTFAFEWLAKGRQTP